MYSNSLIETTIYNPSLTGLALGLMIFSMILGLILIISYWKILNKANKPGWALFIPIYNTIVMIQVAKLPLWYILLFLIPIANIYAIFKINIEIAKKFGKSSGFGVGMTLIPIIFIPLLAFADSKYEDNTTENSNNTNNTFDISNIINNTDDASVEEKNLDIQESIPVVPTIEVEEQNIQENNNIDSTVGTETNVIEEQQNIPVFENSAPSIEDKTLDMNILNNNELPIVEEPVIVESVEVPNAFSSVPLQTENLTTENTKIDESSKSSESLQDIVETLLNNDNNYNLIPEVEPQIITELPSEEFHSSTETKKICKSCGAELPNIVSICPKCGTDNE